MPSRRPPGLYALILAYLAAHGVVRRSDVVTVCGVSPDTATRLLNELLAAGKLEAVGSQRGRRHRLPTPEGPPPVVAVCDRLAVLRAHILEHGPVGRVGAAAVLGLSPSSATTVLRRLLRAGELRVYGNTRSRRYGLPAMKCMQAV